MVDSRGFADLVVGILKDADSTGKYLYTNL